MKVRVARVTKRIIKPFVNVSAWMGYRQLADIAGGIYRTAKDVFTPTQAINEESFEDALMRFNLTEQDVQDRIKSFTWLTILWLAISVAVLVYAIYLAGRGTWYGFLACIAVTLITLAQTFYYHFWLYQMKQRRLGCTFREWLNASFTFGGKP